MKLWKPDNGSFFCNDEILDCLEKWKTLVFLNKKHHYKHKYSRKIFLILLNILEMSYHIDIITYNYIYYSYHNV